MLVTLLVLGCRPPVATTAAPPLAPPLSQEEQLWTRRHDRAALEAALDLYAARATEDPADRPALEHLTRGWLLLADAHAPDIAAAQADRETALRWGDACLALNPDHAAVREKARVSAAAVASTLTAADAACAYWSSLALRDWSATQGTSTAERHRDRIEAQMTQVTRLSPELFHGGPDRFWGTHYATLPDYAGQDLALARTHFEQARQIGPDYLGTTTDMAAHWAVAAGDQAAFADLLGAVLAADPTVPEALRAENEAARRTAERLQARQTALFAD